MKIGIDAILLEREMTGIGRYLRNVLDCLLEIDRKNEYFLFSLGQLPNKYKNKGFKIISFKKNISYSKFLKFYSPFWLVFVLPFLLKRNPIDIFWQPNHFLPPFFTSKNIKFIITIHDTVLKIDRNYRGIGFGTYLDLLLPKSIKKSKKIITISQNSKKDIINFYKVPENRIKVIYSGIEEKFQPRDLENKQKENLRKKYNLPKEFILYISGIEKRKNIQAIFKIADRLNEIKFVLFGKLGFKGKEILEKIKKRNNVNYYGFVDEDDLPYIYNLAKIFIFPSLYEGFGFPPLEAMACGIPVITSNVSSLPEIVEEGGLMHEPNDIESFVRDISKLLEDKDFYKKMREKAIKQATKFSWKKATEELIEEFNKL